MHMVQLLLKPSKYERYAELKQLYNELKRQEKKTEVKQKDGTVKVIQKYKRKK